MRKIIYIKLLLVCSLAVFYISLPFIAQAQPAVLNPCWTESECESAGGLWGKSTEKYPDETSGISGFELDDGKSNSCQDIDNQDTAKCYAKPPTIKLQVPIPGLSQEFTGGLAVYISYFYKFFISAIAVMAVVMVMWGGFKRLYAAGSPDKIKDANDTIVSAISSLVIALLSYTLLNLVNPKLVDIPGLAIEMPKRQGFGEWCGDDIEKANPAMRCGDIYKDPNTGYKCRISTCMDTGTGCFPDPDKPKTNNFLSYSCQENHVACKKVTDENVKQYHGNASEEHDVYESACNSFSKDEDMCTWVEYYGPMSNDDKCEWYSKDFRDQFCKGKTKCDDFNIFLWGNGILPTFGPSGTEFAACHKDWCNFGCKVFWMDRQVPSVPITVMEYWYCYE